MDTALPQDTSLTGSGKQVDRARSVVSGGRQLDGVNRRRDPVDVAPSARDLAQIEEAVRVLEQEGTGIAASRSAGASLL